MFITEYLLQRIIFEFAKYCLKSHLIFEIASRHSSIFFIHVKYITFYMGTDVTFVITPENSRKLIAVSLENRCMLDPQITKLRMRSLFLYQRCSYHERKHLLPTF